MIDIGLVCDCSTIVHHLLFIICNWVCLFNCLLSFIVNMILEKNNNYKSKSARPNMFNFLIRKSGYRDLFTTPNIQTEHVQFFDSIDSNRLHAP